MITETGRSRVSNLQSMHHCKKTHSKSHMAVHFIFRETIRTTRVFQRKEAAHFSRRSKGSDFASRCHFANNMDKTVQHSRGCELSCRYARRKYGDVMSSAESIASTSRFFRDSLAPASLVRAGVSRYRRRGECSRYAILGKDNAFVTYII